MASLVALAPLLTDVLRSQTGVGFITPGVTRRINAAGLAALLLLLWDLRAEREDRVRLWTWMVMATAQAALLALHPLLDGFLNPTTRDVADPDRFYGFHRIYPLLTTVQWLARDAPALDRLEGVELASVRTGSLARNRCRQSLRRGRS